MNQQNLSQNSYFQVFSSVNKGSEPLFFELSRNGQIIKSSPNVNYKIDSFKRFSTLSIESIDRRDAANYTCLVKNAFGSDSQSVLLSIKGRNYLIVFIV